MKKQPILVLGVLRDGYVHIFKLRDFSSYTVRICSMTEISLSCIITVVSSTYNMHNNISDTFKMSFMYVLHQKQHTGVYISICI